MAKMQITVCDTCKSRDKSTTNYRIVSEGRTKELDLCDDDNKGIEVFMEGTRARGGNRRGRVPGAGRTASMEEIEAAKSNGSAETSAPPAPAKKAAAKKATPAPA